MPEGAVFVKTTDALSVAKDEENVYSHYIMDDREAKTRLHQAIEAGKKRDYRGCISLLLPVVATRNDVADAALYLGRAWHALGEYTPAIAYLRDFHRAKPESVAGMFFLGRAYYCGGFPKEALFQLKRAWKAAPQSAQIGTYLAFAYLKAGRHDIALPLLSNLVEQRPENTKIYQAYLNTLYVQAIRLFHRGDVKQSMEMFSFLQERGVESVLLYLYLGMGAREEGRLHDALWAYEKALELSPDDEMIRYRRAVLLFQTGRKSEALKELSQLKHFGDDKGELDPLQADYRTAVRYYETGNFRKASYHALRLLKAGSDDIEIRLLIGESLRHLGDFQRAENHFRRALDLDRTRIEARYGIAMVLWQQQRFEEMLHVLRQIDRSDPDNEIARYYTPLVFWKLERDPSRGITLALKALEDNKEDPFLMTALGDFHLRSGNSKDAETWYMKALGINPEMKEALLGVIPLHEQQEEDVKIAQKLTGEYRSLIKLLGNDRIYMRKLMLLLYRLSDFSACAEQAKALLALIPEDLQALRVLGISLRKQERYLEAALVYRRLLRKAPFHERFLTSHVWCLEKANQGNQAAAFLENALSAMPDPPYSLLLILGKIYYHLDNYDEAASTFRKAMQLSPESWQAYQNLASTLRKLGQEELATRYFSKADEKRKKSTSHF